MSMPKFDSVDDYIASQSPDRRRWLRTARATIRRTVPAALESISYGIPAYKLDGRVLIYFAAWKSHYALYPASAALRVAFAKDLAAYDVSKGTIRLPMDEPAPVELMRRLATFRLSEATKPAARKAPRASR